MVEKFLNIQS